MNGSRPIVHDDGGLAGPVFLIPLLFGAAVVVLLIGSAAGWHPLWPENAATLSETVALRDRPGALALIASGHNPNAVYPVREELLTSRALQITPLQAAVSTRETYMVDMLVANGARLDDATRRNLICLARTTNAGEIEAQLSAGLPAPVDCANVTLPW
jgi:hypothetical protein